MESRGKPKAVIMSISAYEEVQELREQKRRADALEQLRALHARVAARNQDLTEDEAMEIADRLSHEMIDDMAARGDIVVVAQADYLVSWDKDLLVLNEVLGVCMVSPPEFLQLLRQDGRS